MFGSVYLIFIELNACQELLILIILKGLSRERESKERTKYRQNYDMFQIPVCLQYNEQMTTFSKISKHFSMNSFSTHTCIPNILCCMLCYICYIIYWAVLVSVAKNPPDKGDSGNQGLILGSGISLGEGNCSPFQYSCLENSMDRETWQAIVHGTSENQTQLSD